MRHCVFVNSKCKNNVNNVKKSDCNNAFTITVDNNRNIHQVGEHVKPHTSKSDKNQLRGNNSTKVGKYDAHSCLSQSNRGHAGIKVRNHFESLSWVDDTYFNPNSGVSNDLISDADTNISRDANVIPILQSQILMFEFDNEILDISLTLDLY